MKNKTLNTILFIVSILLWNGCAETEYSKDYDINFPVAKALNISTNKPFVDEDVTIIGENLNTVTNVTVGTYEFKIKSVSADGKSMVITVPRSIEPGQITLMNKYRRLFNSELTVTPQFYPAKVLTWPSEIQKGKPFTLKGENMDLIKEVKLNGKVVSMVGAASISSVTYASSAVELEIGQDVVIEVTPKAGEKQTSGPIKVIKPLNTYIPKQTIMLWDFETAPTTWDGWGGSPFTAGLVNDGFFGKAYKLTSPAGNSWNGCYIRLVNDNSGKGFDLSAYTKPHITFLVNTHGKKGYFNPAITIGGSESDKHFTGQGGQYSDNYVISTQGWEWRSYDLEKMGWANIKGKIDRISLWIRGGNVGETEPFDIAIDQVMITDGPLNPTLIWDTDSKLNGSVTYTPNGGTNLTGYHQGTGYATYKYNVTNSWDWIGDIATNPDVSLNAISYANGAYINFLVNTGPSNGYLQIVYIQGENKLADQILGQKYYGDHYKIKPTNGKWEWRSLKIDPATLSVWGGAADKFDFSKSFAVSIIVRSGDISGGPFELNTDYFVFTTVPLDPNLVQE